MMDAHQAKMRLVQSVGSSLIPGEVFIHLQYVQIHFKVTFFVILDILNTVLITRYNLEL